MLNPEIYNAICSDFKELMREFIFFDSHIKCILYILQCIYYSVNITVYILQCTYYSVHITVIYYSVHITVYILQCT